MGTLSKEFKRRTKKAFGLTKPERKQLRKKFKKVSTKKLKKIGKKVDFGRALGVPGRKTPTFKGKRRKKPKFKLVRVRVR